MTVIGCVGGHHPGQRTTGTLLVTHGKTAASPPRPTDDTPRQGRTTNTMGERWPTR
jgi:hypothetical protein